MKNIVDNYVTVEHVLSCFEELSENNIKLLYETIAEFQKNSHKNWVEYNSDLYFGEYMAYSNVLRLLDNIILTEDKND